MKTTQRRREDVPFGFAAGAGMPVYAQLAGVPFHRVFLDADAIIEAYTKGLPRARELFGPDVGLGGPGWAGISYGHVNALGCPMFFPEDSEVGTRPIYGSLDEGIRALRREVDFASQGLFPDFLRLWDRLKRAFPDQAIRFSYKAEGPITTAWLLRGHDFFVDLLDQPEQAREYLRLVTRSVVRYSRLIERINGKPEVSSTGCGVADDAAAMVRPGLWPEMVMPFLEQYYEGLTTGARSAHIEDLTAAHLPYLDRLGLDSFDPSVSPRLTAALVRDGCRAPFAWRLNSMHLREMDETAIERWALQSVADGASTLSCVVMRENCAAPQPDRVRAFIRAGRRIKAMLADGVAREKLAEG